MVKKTRQSRILAILDEQGSSDVSYLADFLGCSEMTIRRDLEELNNSGKIDRIHGGAAIKETPVGSRQDEIQKEMQIPHCLEKRQIARCAISNIQENDIIYMGTGTTVAMMARFLEMKNLLVVTNSYPVFEVLSKTMPDQVILTGGLLNDKTGAFVGSIPSTILKSMKFSAAFVSCSAIHDNDLMVNSMEEGDIEKIALQNARRKYLLADNTKFNTEGFYIVGSLKDIDTVISDTSLTQEVQNQYRQYTDIQRGRNVAEESALNA